MEGGVLHARPLVRPRGRVSAVLSCPKRDFGYFIPIFLFWRTSETKKLNHALAGLMGSSEGAENTRANAPRPPHLIPVDRAALGQHRKRVRGVDETPPTVYSGGRPYIRLADGTIISMSGNLELTVGARARGVFSRQRVLDVYLGAQMTGSTSSIFAARTRPRATGRQDGRWFNVVPYRTIPYRTVPYRTRYLR